MMYLQKSFTVPAAPEKITACEACVFNRASEQTARRVGWDARSEGNSQQEFSLVLVTRKAAIGVEKVLRSPPRVADFRLQVNDEQVHVETGAEHEPAGGIVADEGVGGDGGQRHYRPHRLLQARQSIPGHTSIHIRTDDLGREPEFGEQRKFPCS